jgi:hypothetical protein
MSLDKPEFVRPMFFAGNTNRSKDRRCSNCQPQSGHDHHGAERADSAHTFAGEASATATNFDSETICITCMAGEYSSESLIRQLPAARDPLDRANQAAQTPA